MNQNIHKDTSGYLITFDVQKYDPAIDFIKGLCILFVVWIHCFGSIVYYSLFPLWGSPAVPIFLLIQVFHAYKKGLDNVQVSLGKLWNRIIKPFVIVMVAILILKLLFSPKTALEIVKQGIRLGGFGPGCYYPYVYIQFALLLPFVGIVFKKIKNIHIIGLLFIAASVLFEMVCSISEMPKFIYRLLCFRYLLIIFLGYLLVNNKLRINSFTIALSLISAACILYFKYNGYQFDLLPNSIKNVLTSFFSVDLYPFFYDAWSAEHWINYFWNSYLYLFFLLVLYEFVQRFEVILSFVIKMGKYSYEIFLFQMLYFSCGSKFKDILNNTIDNRILVSILYIMISTVICIGTVYIWKKMIETRQVKNSK